MLYVMGLAAYEEVWEGLRRVPIYRPVTIRAAAPGEALVPPLSAEWMLQWLGSNDDSRYRIPDHIWAAAHAMRLRVNPA